MNFSAFGWRADGGFLPPSNTAPVTMPPAYMVAPVVAVQPTPPVHYVAAPLGIYGVVSQRPAPVPPPAYAAVVRADATAQNPNAPPSLRPGMNYMFAPEHTHLHIFNKASRIWEDKYRGQSQ